MLVCRILSRPRVGVATQHAVFGISEGAGGGFRGCCAIVKDAGQDLFRGISFLAD